MTKNNSIISSIMREHKDDWREHFETHYPKIKIKEKYGFAIFNYCIDADFSDPVVREARGIIIDTSSFDVVCWPFTKFCKYDESRGVDAIDWSAAIVEEKIDGSIVKLWYDSRQKMWRWSTNASIDAKDAYINLECEISFLDIIKETEEYDKIKMDSLFEMTTYIFELVSPDTQVVIHYDKPKLYLIGARNRQNGEEYEPRYIMSFEDFPKPKIYNELHSLEDCINYFKTIETDIIHGPCDLEGFVVVDKYFHRIKVKNPVYLCLHGLIDNNKISVKNLIKLLLNGKIDVASVSKQLPKIAPIVKYYDYKITEIIHYLDREIRNIRNDYQSSYCDRKYVAKKISKGNYKYSAILFNAIDNELTAKEIMDNMHNIANYLYERIPMYEVYEGK